MPFTVTQTMLGCPVPPPYDCGDGQCGGSCIPGGEGPCTVSTDGQLSCKAPGPGAHLRYRAKGAGHDDFPGTGGPLDWRTTLGLYWSHDYAQRIVEDPDESHVWLITEGASFREFSALAAGGGLRAYGTNSPSDEFRKLFYDTPTQTWQLLELDGVRHFFRSDGQWEKTVRPEDPTHPKQATYSGAQLQSVAFPDGRSETFTYYGGGKLNTITEVGVGASPTRTWTYTWTGDELVRVERPDTTKWEYFYDPTRPGFLTRIDLVGTDGSTRRVDAAFEYDAFDNVAKSWRGTSISTSAWTSASTPTPTHRSPPRRW